MELVPLVVVRQVSGEPIPSTLPFLIFSSMYVVATIELPTQLLYDHTTDARLGGMHPT
jgi:hypothetical protein